MRTFLFLIGLVLAVASNAGRAQSEPLSLLKQGAAYRQRGDLHLAIDTLSNALRQAGDAQLKTRIAGEVGVA